MLKKIYSHGSEASSMRPVEDAVVDREDIDFMAGLADELSGLQRQVFIRWLRGDEFEIIASELGIPVESVYGYKNRAFATTKKVLESWFSNNA